MIVPASRVEAPAGASYLTVQEGQPVSDGQGEDQHVVVVEGVLREVVVQGAQFVVLCDQPQLRPVTWREGQGLVE